MNKKDYNNTYNKKPENYSEHTNKATGAYTKTGVRGDIKTENKDFVQINIKYQAELAELAITEPAARAIFDLFVTRMENNNTYITNSTKLAAALHKTKRTAERAIKVLRERNFVVPYFRISGNQGTAYFINPHIACKCSATQKQFLIEKFLTIVDDKTYHAKEENIDIKTLIDKDRLVLKSDEKRQLDSLNRVDNVKIHAMVQLTNAINSMEQEEILDLLKILKNKVPTTDEEQQQAQENIEKKKKGIELMQEQTRLLKEEAKVTAQLEEAEAKSDNGVISMLLNSYWKDAFGEDENGNG